MKSALWAQALSDVPSRDEAVAWAEDAAVSLLALAAVASLSAAIGIQWLGGEVASRCRPGPGGSACAVLDPAASVTGQLVAVTVVATLGAAIAVSFQADGGEGA